MTQVNRASLNRKVGSIYGLQVNCTWSFAFPRYFHSFYIFFLRSTGSIPTRTGKQTPSHRSSALSTLSQPPPQWNTHDYTTRRYHSIFYFIFPPASVSIYSREKNFFFSIYFFFFIFFFFIYFIIQFRYVIYNAHIMMSVFTNVIYFFSIYFNGFQY